MNKSFFTLLLIAGLTPALSSVPKKQDLNRVIPIETPFERATGKATILSEKNASKWLNNGFLGRFILGAHGALRLNQTARKTFAQLHKKYAVVEIEIHNRKGAQQILEFSATDYFNEVPLVLKEQVAQAYPHILYLVVASILGMAGPVFYNGMAPASDLLARGVGRYGRAAVQCGTDFATNMVTSPLSILPIPMAFLQWRLQSMYAALRRINKPAIVYNEDGVAPLIFEAPISNGIMKIVPGCSMKHHVIVQRDLMSGVNSLSLKVQ